MKRVKIIIPLFIIAILFSSCELFFDKDTTEEISEITTFPIFKLEGNDVMIWELDKAWVEPGYHCSEVEEGEDDLNSTVVVDNSDLDISTPGVYSISYTGTNSYDYSVTVYRTVIVQDPTATNFDISGSYYYGFNVAQMDITKDIENDQFYYATNIYDHLTIVAATIINLGDKNYAIAKGYNDELESYYEGSAEFSEATNKIVFSILLTDSEGNELTVVKNWTKN